MINCKICNNKLSYNKENKSFLCEKCNKYYDINLNQIDDLNLYKKIDYKEISNNYKMSNISCNNCNGKLAYNKTNKTFFCKECNKYYDIDLNEIKNIKLYIPKNEIEEEKDVEVKCPCCGSKQIQLVNRKWTPFMGILTNKVDRVCMNCKHKF